MGARSKLNGAVLNGSLLIGGLVALASGSPITGVVIGAILATIGVISGDIRLTGPPASCVLTLFGAARSNTPAGVTTKSKGPVTGLTSGTKYWFRVAAVGAAGQGAWSNPASRTAQ